MHQETVVTGGLVEGPWLARMRPTIERVAASDLPVLILGETGCGKEMIADIVHRMSARADRPLLRINCAALPEALLESELFGYERGAFTGAERPKPGLLEVAAGGTVFLDELFELPPAVQAKLLRVVEHGRMQRLGDLSDRPVDVRYIGATSRDVAKAIARGAFRADLLYRLNAFTLGVPPLRERRDEVELIARMVMARVAARLGRPEPALSKAAIDMLLEHDWPGNVRELRNAMERAVILCDGVIEPEHLPPALGAPEEPDTAAWLRSIPSRAERTRRELVIEALRLADGNQTHAARLLGVSRRTLIKRLDRYRLPRPRKLVYPDA